MCFVNEYSAAYSIKTLGDKSKRLMGNGLFFQCGTI